MLDAVGREPPRSWSADRPAAFTARDDAGGSGSVPPDGARRLASVLDRLGGRRIVVHGTGEHTRQLADVLKSASVSLVAFTDDDRQRHGSVLLGRPIIAPHDAGETGATDVVISSWINQSAVWRRRAVYERQGIRVHTLYSAY
jgi:FlaA1/EpsC-like NDP-sugar epimerase